MDDEFDILAAKVLAGEATAEDRSRFEALLARSNERRAEYAALQATWNSLKQAGPVLQAKAAPQAEIPAERLRQLQQAVRDAHQVSPSAQTEKVRPRGQTKQPVGVAGKPGIWRQLLECASPLALWLARPGAQKRQRAAALQDARTPVSPWLRQWSGLSQGLVTLALILLVGGAFLWLNQPGAERSSAASTAPVAHLLALQGQPEVRRAGQLLPATSAVVLRDGDKIHLPVGTEASLITPGGDVRLQGPVSGNAIDLIANARSSNRRTNAVGQTSTLYAALFQPVPELLNSGLLVTTRSAQGIALYSPAGATASLTPLILWKAEPGKTYDLRITDEFDAATPAWTLSAVTSPIEFANVAAWKDRPLARDGLYRLRISETGRALTTCEYTFQTVKEDRDSSVGAITNPLEEALRILTTSPSRVGDALALLLTMPPDLATSELALRLKSLLFGQFGYADDFDAATTRLTSPK